MPGQGSCQCQLPVVSVRGRGLSGWPLLYDVTPRGNYSKQPVAAWRFLAGERDTPAVT